MMTDILGCHQPNKVAIRKMACRSDFLGLHQMALKAHKDGDWRGERKYSQWESNALSNSVDNNHFSRLWYKNHQP